MVDSPDTPCLVHCCTMFNGFGLTKCFYIYIIIYNLYMVPAQCHVSLPPPMPHPGLRRLDLTGEPIRLVRPGGGRFSRWDTFQRGNLLSWESAKKESSYLSFDLHTLSVLQLDVLCKKIGPSPLHGSYTLADRSHGGYRQRDQGRRGDELSCANYTCGCRNSLFITYPNNPCRGVYYYFFALKTSVNHYKSLKCGQMSHTIIRDRLGRGPCHRRTWMRRDAATCQTWRQQIPPFTLLPS